MPNVSTPPPPAAFLCLCLFVATLSRTNDSPGDGCVTVLDRLPRGLALLRGHGKLLLQEPQHRQGREPGARGVDLRRGGRLGHRDRLRGAILWTGFVLGWGWGGAKGERAQATLTFGGERGIDFSKRPVHDQR